MKKRFSLFILLTGAFISLHAQEEKKQEYKRQEHFRERNISKTYPASGNALVINNSFGDVTVTTGGSEIKVDIHIEASSSNKEHADKIFENLDVADSKDGNTVKFKTSTNKNNKGDNYNCKNCNSSMMISYKVQLPAGTPLTIENSFGDIILPDYNGPVNLTSKFGDLQTGALSKAEKIQSEFGGVNIKEVTNLNSSFKFSTVTIGSLGGNNKINLEFCKGSRINLAGNISSLDLKESYSLINLVPSASLAASYDIRTSYSSFKNKTNTDIKRTDNPDEYGPDADRHFEGRSGSGSVKIDIRSSFGKLILGEATAEEMKEKDKQKGNGKVI